MEILAPLCRAPLLSFFIPYLQQIKMSQNRSISSVSVLHFGSSHRPQGLERVTVPISGLPDLQRTRSADLLSPHVHKAHRANGKKTSFLERTFCKTNKAKEKLYQREL